MDTAIPSIRIVTFAEQPMTEALEAQVAAVIHSAWHPIALNDNIGNQLWDRLYTDLPAFQFLGYSGDDRLVLVGNSIPVFWDRPVEALPDDGWDWAIASGFERFDAGEPPNMLSALSVSIMPDHQGIGLSRIAIQTMKTIAAQHGLTALIAPVRPNHKPQYPLTPIERYITWTREDGAPFDPWLRTHWRIGGKIIKPCPRSMRVAMSVAAFEEEIGMPFPESGAYLVPGGLNPAHVDREADCVEYIEPNVWVVHPV